MSRLRLGEGFAFPLELVTESVAILAVRRAGKSNTAKVLVEELHRAAQQVVIVDPKGDWWGIRSSADGQGPGLPIVILGGQHGDKPLTVDSGEVVARLVVEQTVSVLLDLSDFRKHEVSTFSTAFLETLYRLKAQEKYRTPVMVIFEEADEIAPQQTIDNSQKRMLGAAEDLVRRGGQRGIGICLITQRAAVINKNVLTQCGILILLRTTGSQDIDAVDAWIKKHGQQESREKVLASIAAMPRGTTWVWAPGWPDEHGIFRQVAINRCWTFDSGATPRPGQRRVVPKTMADVDLEAFAREMAATVERVKADDPKELRRQLGEAKRALEAERKKTPAAAPGPKVEVRKVAMLTEAQVARLDAAAGRLDVRLDALEERTRETVHMARDAVVDLREAIRKESANNAIPIARMVAPPSSPQPPVRRAPAPPRQQASPRAPADSDGTVELGGGGDRRMLIALAQNQEGITARKLSLLSGIAIRGGTFRTYLGNLKKAGWAVGDRSHLEITVERRAVLGAYEPLPTGPELIEWWRRELGESGMRAMLDVLVKHYPKPMSRDELGEASNIAVAGGTFRTYLGKLRTLELVSKDHDGLRAADVLFE